MYCFWLCCSKVQLNRLHSRWSLSKCRVQTRTTCYVGRRRKNCGHFLNLRWWKPLTMLNEHPLSERQRCYCHSHHKRKRHQRKVWLFKDRSFDSSIPIEEFVRCSSLLPSTFNDHLLHSYSQGYQSRLKLNRSFEYQEQFIHEQREF